MEETKIKELSTTRTETGFKRMVLFLHVHHGFTAKEITTLTGTNTEKVESYLLARSGNDWDDFIKQSEKMIADKDAREIAEAQGRKLEAAAV